MLLVVVITISCEDFVAISPPKTQIVSASVFSNDANATSAILGIYSEMLNNLNSGFASGGPSGITLFAGFSSDEFIEISGNSNNGTFYTNSLLPAGSVPNSFWKPVSTF